MLSMLLLWLAMTGFTAPAMAEIEWIAARDVHVEPDQDASADVFERDDAIRITVSFHEVRHDMSRCAFWMLVEIGRKAIVIEDVVPVESVPGAYTMTFTHRVRAEDSDANGITIHPHATSMGWKETHTAHDAHEKANASGHCVNVAGIKLDKYVVKDDARYKVHGDDEPQSAKLESAKREVGFGLPLAGFVVRFLAGLSQADEGSADTASGASATPADANAAATADASTPQDPARQEDPGMDLDNQGTTTNTLAEELPPQPGTITPANTLPGTQRPFQPLIPITVPPEGQLPLQPGTITTNGGTTNNEPTEVTLSRVIMTPDVFNVQEDRTATYTIVLDANPGGDVTVEPHTNRPARLGVTAAFTFSADNWSTPQTVTVTGFRDTDDDDRVVGMKHVVHSEFATGEPHRVSGFGIITILDGFSEVTIAPASVTERDDESVDMVFDVSIDPPLESLPGSIYYQPLRATDKDTYATGMNPATPGDDFEALRAVSGITFPVRATSASITVRVLPDNVAEGSELIRLMVGISGGDAISDRLRFADPTWGREHYVHGVIHDDDVSGIAVSPRRLTVDEGRETTYTVALSTTPTAPVTITPTPGSEAALTASGAMVFTQEQWNVPQTVTVTGVPREDEQHIDVTVSHAAASLDAVYHGQTLASVRVRVNHYNPAFARIANHVVIDENGIGSYRLKLEEPPLADVTVTPTSGDPALLSVGGAHVFSVENWHQAGTIAVTSHADQDRVNNAIPVTHTVSSDDHLFDGITTEDVDVTVVVVDDFLYQLSIDPVSVTEGDSEPVDLIFTVSLNEPVAAGRIELAYMVPDMESLQEILPQGASERDDAVMGEDYVGQSQTQLLTIRPGQSRALITVPVLPDRTVEREEVFYMVHGNARILPTSEHPPAGRLSLRNPSIHSVYLAQGSILDNDVAGVGIAPSALEIAGGATGTYSVVLNSTPHAPVTIAPTAQDASVAIIGDALTFTAANWSAPQTVTVSAIGTDHIGEQARITHNVVSEDPWYRVPNVPTITVTVTITDPSPALLSVADASVAEHPNGSVMTFPVTLGIAKPQTILVGYETSDGTATAGGDYQATSGTLTFAAGAQSASVSVTVHDDVLVEGDIGETFTLILTSTSPFLYIEGENINAETTSRAQRPAVSVRATGTITDNDATPTSIALSLSPEDLLERAGATPITVTASLGAVAFDAVRTIRVTATGSGASNVVPVAQIPAFYVTVPAGQFAASATFTVTPTNNAVDEANEVITLSGTDRSVNPIDVTSATLTILDDDRPSVSVVPPEEDDDRPANVIVLREGETKAYSLRFHAQPSRRLSVSATSKNERAAKILSETLLFTELNWAATQKITVKGEQDDNAVNETVTITHRSTPVADETVPPTRPPVRPGQPAPTRPLPPPRVRSAHGRFVHDASSYVRSGGSRLVRSSGGAILANHDTGPVTQQQQQQQEEEQDEFASIDDTVVIVLDDDEAEVNVSATALTLAEAAVATYTVVLTAQPSLATVTVTAETDETFASVSSPLTFTPLNWSVPQTITVTGAAIGDADTRDATTTVTHAVAGGEYAGVAVSDVVLTITDPDVPVLSVSNPTVTEGQGAQLVFDVTIPAADDQAVTVQYAVTHGTTTDADVTLVPNGTLTIAANATTAHLTLTVLDDNRFEPDESLTLTLTNPTNAVFAEDVESLTATGIIENDDAAPTDVVLTAQPTQISEAAGATEITVTASLSGATTFDAERIVTLATSGSGALSISGGGVPPGVVGFSPVLVTAAELTIAPGASTGTATFTLMPEDDLDNEADETVTINGASADGLNIAAATLTLIDDDLSSVIVHLSQDAVLVDEGSEATYGVSLSSSPPVTVSLSPEDSQGGGAATASGELTFTALNWNAVQTITVTGTADDDTADATTTITHRLTERNGGADVVRTAMNPVEVRVRDDDVASITITPAALTVAEGATASYAVSLSHVPTMPVTVAAQAGTSVVTTSDALTFTPSNWRDAHAITVTGAAAGDADTLDASTTLTHAVSGGEYQGVAAAALPVTVTDPDTPTLSMAAVSVTEAAGAELRFEARIAAADDQPVTVQYQTRAGSATADEPTLVGDFTPTSGVLTIEPEQTSAAVVVPILDDGLHEGSETLTLMLESPTNAHFPNDAESLAAVGTVIDDEPMPGGIALNLNAATITEGDAANPITITATVEGGVPLAATSTVTIAFATASSSGETAPSHAQISGFDMTIPGGATVATATFDPQPVNDTVGGQADAVITVSGSHSLNIPVASTTLSITDDDTPPTVVTLTVAPGTVFEDAGDAVQVVVTASFPNPGTTWARDIPVTISAASASALSGSDFTAAEAELTIPSGAHQAAGTLTLAITDDLLHEGAEAIAITGSSTDAGILEVTPADITITDNDAAPTNIVLSTLPASVSEGDGNTPVTVVATMLGGVTFATERVLTISVDGSEDAGLVGFAQVADFPVTIPAAAVIGQGTFTLQPVDDNSASATHAITVSGVMDEQASAGLQVQAATVLLTDDDTPPVVITLTTEPQTISEGSSGPVPVAVTASFPSTGPTWDRDVVLAVTAASGTARAGTDFTAGEGIVLTIPSGTHAATGTINLSLTNDTRHEGDETITITGTTTDADIQAVIGATLTLTDDDAAPTGIELTLNRTRIAEADAATEIIITATVGGAATFNEPVTITLSPGGDAEAGSDYQTPTLPPLVLEAGATSVSATFTLTAINDAVDEGNETIEIVGTLTGASVPLSLARLTLIDDDSTGMTLTGNALTITENTSASYVVSLHSRPLHPVRVTLSVSGDTAAASIEPASQELIFPATQAGWDEPQTVTVTAVADTDTHDHALIIEHAVTSSDGNYHGLGLPSVSVGVTDPQLPTLSVDAAQGAETGGAVLDFEVRLAAADDAPVTVQYQTRDGSANAGQPALAGDYMAASGTLTFNAGQTVATVPVTVLHDVMHEGNETFTLELTAPTNARFADGGAVLSTEGAILDNDAAPTGIDLTASRANITEADAATAITVTAAPSGGTTFDAPVTITLSLSGDAGASDYQTSTLPPLTLGVGAAHAEAVFTLTPIDDAIDENDETVVIHGATTDVAVPLSPATLVLIDNDGAGIAVTPTVLNLVEGDPNNAAARYAISLRSRPLHPVRVVVTPGGDAEAISIAPSSRELVFPATQTGWNIPQTVTVSAVDDADTRDHVLSIHHAATSDDGHYGGVAIPSVAVSVTDPGQPVLSMAATRVVEPAGGEGAQMRFEVRLAGAADEAVTVRYQTRDGSASAGTDFIATSGTLTINAGQTSATVPVTVLHDVLHEGDETFALELTHPTNASFSNGAAELVANGDIIDNDAAPTDIALSLTPNGAPENGRAMQVTLAATVAGGTRFAQPVTIALSLAGTATVDEDYEASLLPTPPVLTIAAGAASGEVQLTFTALDDLVREGDETVIVEGTHETATVSAATLTIADDEPEPRTSPIAPTPLTGNPLIVDVGEGETATYTLMLTLQPHSGTTVTITPQTADAGAVTVSGPLTFTAEDWNVAQTVTVSGVQDADAAPEAVMVTHQTSGAHSASLEALPASMGIRVADDETPHVTITPTALTLTENGTANYTAVLGYVPTVPVTVDITAPAIVDAPDALTFDAANWNTVQTVTITGVPTGDPDALDRQANITHVARGGEYQDVQGAAIAVTLTDPDVPALSVADAVVTEAPGAQLRFEVRLDAIDDQAVTVAYDTADGSATAQDYEAVDGTLTIAAGALSTTVTVPVLDDDRYEGDETLTFTLSNPSNASFARSEGAEVLHNPHTRAVSGVIKDDETAPSGIALSVSPSSMAEGSPETTLTVSAAIDGGTPFDVPRTVTVSFDVPNAEDVVENTGSLADLALVIEAGATTAATTFVLQPADDVIAGQDDEVITISGADSEGLPVSPATLTITDDDAAPTAIALNMTPVQLDEAAPVTQVTVTATIQGATRFAHPQTLDLSLTGAATVGEDYAAVTLSALVLEAGAVSGEAVFSIKLIDDAEVEEAETITVSGNLRGAANAPAIAMTITPATLTIIDDDVAPEPAPPEQEPTPPVAITLTASPARIDEGNGATAITVTAQAASTLTEARILAVSLSNDTTGTPEADFREVPAFDLTIVPGQSTQTATFTLTPIDDAVAETEERIAITATDTGTNPASITPVSITLTDNDQAGLHITEAGTAAQANPGVAAMDALAVNEGDSGAYAVMLTSQPMAPTTVLVRSANARKMVTDVAALLFTPDNWNQGQAVTVTGMHDDDPHGEEIMLMHETASTDAHYQGRTAELMVRITDDDHPRLVNIELTSRPLQGDVFGIGEVIRLRLDFSRPVRVWGTPTLKLALGEHERRAELASGPSASNALIFTYAVQAGDRADAITIPQDPVQLGQGDSIVDAEEAAMHVRLTHPEMHIPVAVNGDRDTMLVADAGEDIEVREQTRAHLDGGGSRSAEPENLAYAWAQSEHHAVAPVALEASNTATPSFVAPNLASDTELTFILTVTNTRTGDEDTDAVLVTILAENDTPTAEAGEDQTVAENAPVTLDGSRSHDPEGAPLTFAWVQADNDAPRVRLDDASSPKPTFTAPSQLIDDARLVFVLTVTDPGGARDSDQVTVTTRAVDLNPMMRHALAAFGRTVGASAVDTISARTGDAGGHASMMNTGNEPAPADGHAFTGGVSMNGIGTNGIETTAPPLSQEARAWLGNDHFAARVGDRASVPQPTPSLSAALRSALRSRPNTTAVGESALNTENALEAQAGQGASTGEKSPWAVWGRGDLRGFSSQPAANASLDGTMQASYLGIDRRWSDHGILGLALSASGSRTDYVEGHVAGTVQTRLRSLFPYIRWSGEQGYDLWGMVGIGTGTAEIATDYGRSAAADITMQMLASGVRRAFLNECGTGWAAKADAFLLNMAAQESDKLNPMDISLSGLRLAAEARGMLTQSDTTQLRSTGELAARLDGGDAETGLGIEVHGGLAYLYAPVGFTMEVRGRYLLAHTQGAVKQWGASMNVQWHPTFAKGLRLALAPEWGDAQGGGAAGSDLETLHYGNAGAGHATPGAGTYASRRQRPTRMNAELRHEFRIRDWNIKPYASFGLTSGQDRRERIGLHLEALEMRQGQLHLELFGDRTAQGGRAMQPGLQATLQRTVW